MATLRLLVAEGNARDTRCRVAETTPAESYAAVLRSIAPDAGVGTACPADVAAVLPAAIEAYDGIAITGSALNIQDGDQPRCGKSTSHAA